MGESIQLFLIYLVAGPVAAVALWLVLRWLIQRFPSQTRRDLDELKLRVRTIEGIVEHLARSKGKKGD